METSSLPSTLPSVKPLRAFRNPFDRHLTIIHAAISQDHKEDMVPTVHERLEGCYLLAGIHYEGLTVKQIQGIRNALLDGEADSGHPQRAAGHLLPTGGEEHAGGEGH
jgi:large subunit ribosomal protein L10